MRLGIVCLPKKKTGHLLSNVVCGGLCFFYIIPNRQWRYVTPLFPILAISAACFIMFLYSRVHAWKPKQVGIKGDRLKKLAAVFFIVIIASAVAYAGYDAYQMTVRDQIHIPIQEATNYLAGEFEPKPVSSAGLLLQPSQPRHVPLLLASKHVKRPNLAVPSIGSRCFYT